MDFRRGAAREEDGTAIGSGLATSLTRLRRSKAKSKVIVLLTDGSNNAGEIDVAMAADMAPEAMVTQEMLDETRAVRSLAKSAVRRNLRGR